jgi:hypothetical protein
VPSAAEGAKNSCGGGLPAKVVRPSAEVDAFEREAYVRVRPRGGRTLRDVRLKVKFEGITIARGSVEGRLRGPADVPLEFLQPIEADRVYDLVASGLRRGCGRRERETKTVSFTDAGGGGGENPVEPGKPGADVRGMVLDWSGGSWQGNDTRDVALLGIGIARVTCRADSTSIRVIPDDPNRETAIIAWTYRRWDDAFEEGSVQEASTNRFGGAEFNLGFNKFNPPEGRSRGTLTGVISDRLPFDAGGGTGAPATAVELSWEWDFRQGETSRCHIEANFTSEGTGDVPPVARSLVVNWRGEDNAAGNSAWTADVPGLGDARLDCQPTPTGVRRFTLFPDPGVDQATFTAYEGSEVRTTTQTGSPFRYDAPNNGFVVADFGPGRGRLFLSSRWKANDPDLSQNFCHLAGVVVGA